MESRREPETHDDSWTDEQTEQFIMSVASDHGTRLCRRLQARTGFSRETIDEIFNDVLVIVWENRTEYELKKDKAAWLYCVALNRARNHAKSVRFKSEKSVKSLTDAGLATLFEIRNESDVLELSRLPSHIEIVRRALSELTEQEQLIALARAEAAGEPGRKWTQAVADRLEMTPQHVRVKWARTKAKLIRSLADKKLRIAADSAVWSPQKTASSEQHNARKDSHPTDESKVRANDSAQ